MPPKVLAASKGQKSLFSFFNKAAPTPGAATPSPQEEKPKDVPVTTMKMIVEPSAAKGPSIPTPCGVAEISLSPAEETVPVSKRSREDEAPIVPNLNNAKNG
jgi:hypothetical protein